MVLGSDAIMFNQITIVVPLLEYDIAQMRENTLTTTIPHLFSSLTAFSSVNKSNIIALCFNFLETFQINQSKSKRNEEIFMLKKQFLLSDLFPLRVFLPFPDDDNK